MSLAHGRGQVKVGDGLYIGKVRVKLLKQREQKAREEKEAEAGKKDAPAVRAGLSDNASSA